MGNQRSENYIQIAAPCENASPISQHNRPDLSSQVQVSSPRSNTPYATPTSKFRRFRQPCLGYHHSYWSLHASSILYISCQKEKKGTLPSEVIPSLQKSRKSPDGLKASYRSRTAHYCDDSLLSWAASRTGSVKPSKMPNDYNSNSGISYASRSMNPHAIWLVHWPPSCAYAHDSIVLKYHVLTVYTAASHNTANTIPQAHVPPPIHPGLRRYEHSKCLQAVR